MAPLTIGSIIRDAAANVPHHVAVTLGDASITFDELHYGSCRTANALTAFGVQPGDRVAVWSDTSLRTVELFGAVSLSGMVFVPLNPRFSESEARANLAYLRPRLVVADHAHRPVAATIVARLGLELAVIGTGGTSTATDAGTDLDQCTSAASSDPPAADATELDLHAIYLTSGSTGVPKGVMLSHRAAWLRSSPGGSTRAVSAEHGGTVSMFPLFHWAGWQMVTEAWQRRCAAHLVAAPTAEQLLSAVERWRAASLYCIPAVWNRILDVPPERFDTASLRFADTGTSAIPPGLIERLAERFPRARTTVSYGSTEAGGSASLRASDWPAHPGTVGRAAPACSIRVAADGEIEIRTAAMMAGYFEREDETSAALCEGWYRSGDLGEMDADGYLTVIGRKRELIRTGGEWVAPVEVEAALAGLPGVTELAVVGVPDVDWGETICVVVVPADGCSAPDVSAVREHLGARLSPHKHPRRVAAIDALPRTPATGQVRRTALAGLVADLVARSDEPSHGTVTISGRP